MNRKYITINFFSANLQDWNGHNESSFNWLIFLHNVTHNLLFRISENKHPNLNKSNSTLVTRNYNCTSESVIITFKQRWTEKKKKKGMAQHIPGKCRGMKSLSIIAMKAIHLPTSPLNDFVVKIFKSKVQQKSEKKI